METDGCVFIHVKYNIQTSSYLEYDIVGWHKPVYIDEMGSSSIWPLSPLIIATIAKGASGAHCTT